MKSAYLLVFTLLPLCACGQVSGSPEQRAETTPETDAPEKTPEPKYTRQDVPGSVLGREVAEVTLDEIKPAFTQRTVLKLNEIVRRSLAASTDYANSIKQIRHNVEATQTTAADDAVRAKAEAGIEKLRTLHNDALRAQADMNDAVAELKKSNESFSEEVLAGMVKYVNDVERAIGNEIKLAEAFIKS